METGTKKVNKVKGEGSVKFVLSIRRNARQTHWPCVCEAQTNVKEAFERSAHDP